MKEFFTFIFSFWLMSPFTISGESMEPMLSHDDVIMIENYAYVDESPERYDVIVFEGTDEPGKHFVKRIIGLPGETITMKEDVVYIEEDGELIELDEPYIWRNKNEVYSLRKIDGTSYQVPGGKYFVLGDNRDSSYDSRTWKDPFIPKENIEGKYSYTLF
ncbi:signal peptidase I [Patescibacteria group bacterium]